MTLYFSFFMANLPLLNEIKIKSVFLINRNETYIIGKPYIIVIDFVACLGSLPTPVIHWLKEMALTTIFMINLIILYCWHRYSNMGCVFWPSDYNWINMKESTILLVAITIHGEKWMFNYGTAILYVQLYYLDVQL